MHTTAGCSQGLREQHVSPASDAAGAVLQVLAPELAWLTLNAPLAAATCSAVLLLLFWMSRSQLAAVSSSTHSACPPLAAECKGVDPFWAWVSTVAPASSRARTTWVWPWPAAAARGVEAAVVAASTCSRQLSG